MKSFELLEHTADLCIKVKSDSLSGLFEAAAEGLLSNIFDGIELLEKPEKLSVAVKGEDAEELLVKFLNDLIYTFYSRKRLPKGNFNFIKFDNYELKAEADFLYVESFSANFEIKAVTYGNIKIEKKNNLFETMVIADV